MMKIKFWVSVDKIISQSEIVIDRPKGSKHPKFPEFVYPLDYGYLKGTKSSDNSEIDIYRGSQEIIYSDAILCTVDCLKRDCEIKILLGCTEKEKKDVLDFHNSSENMAGIIIYRENYL